MDLDKSLDEQIADKRQSQPRKGPRQSREGGGAGGREGRREALPYARPPPRSADDKWVHDAYSGPKSRGPSNGAGGGSNIASLAGTGAGFTGVSPRIEIVGLHYEVTPSDLKSIFSKAGTIVQGPTIRYDRSGRSKGEATLEYASYQQAKVAINQFDGAMTKGQTISIRLLPPATARGPNASAGPTMARGTSQPQAQTGASLLARIAGNGGGGAKGSPGGPRGDASQRGAGAGGARARGGPPGARGRGAAGGGRGGKRGPASAGDLDKELDSFMKPDSGDVAME